MVEKEARMETFKSYVILKCQQILMCNLLRDLTVRMENQGEQVKEVLKETKEEILQELKIHFILVLNKVLIMIFA